MPRQSMPVKKAAQIAEKIAKDLVDAELVKEPTGRFLRFYIDRDDGVSVDELEAYHRKLMPLVEEVDYDYMEVSSPGADRPLKTERDFARAEGLMVELHTYRAIDGSKRFVGDLAGLRDGAVVLRTGEDEERAFDRKDVAVVRRLLEFTEEDLRDEAPAPQQEI